MTEPTDGAADSSPVSGPTDDHERDRLVASLRDRIRLMAADILAADDSRLARDMPHVDRAEVKAEVLQRTAVDADTLLSTTNEQINELLEAQRALLQHTAPRARPAGQSNPRDKVAHASVGFALWLGIFVPVLCWQLVQTPLSPSAHFWLSVAVVIAGLVSLRPVYQAVARAGRRLTGQPALGGAGWSFATGFVTAYLLMVWRLWMTWRDAMGTGWAVVVWVAIGLVTSFLTLMSFLLAKDPTKDEGPGRRIPRPVVRREALFTVIALVALALLLTGVVRVPWPEWAAWAAADALSLLIAVGGGPLVLGSTKLVPARLSSDPGRRGTPAWTQKRDELAKAVDEADAEWATSIRKPVRRSVTHHLNTVVTPGFSTKLPEIDRSALGQMRAGERAFTETPAGQRLKAVLAGIHGGAVGMAGPRGAGKSTLLEAYQAGRFIELGEVHIALLESVPVKYDAREFVLHLHAQLCDAVLRFCDKRLGTRQEAARPWPARLARLRRLWPFAAVVVAWVVLGVAGSLATSRSDVDLRTWFATMWWPLVSLVGAAAILGIAVRRRPSAMPAYQGPDDEPPKPAPGDLDGLRALAERTRGEIEFQLKHTSGWSGKVGLPIGFEAGVSGSREVTRQQRTYPQIVHEFSDFLKATITCLNGLPHVAPTSVVIILDELDKIASPDVAQDFVNEVKALFNLDVPGFLFLISVSEDALASFERRGLPVRDAFDSAFDLIFRLEYLKLDDSRQVLYSRVLGLPEPFVCLCHCLAGGLPRELVRVARQMISASGSLADVARRLVDEELRDKRGALRTAVARGTYDDVLVSDLVRHIDAHAVADPSALLRAAAHPPITTPSTSDLVSLYRLQVETLGHLYFLGTVLEVFALEFTPADLRRGTTEGDASFDTLTSVRQLFPVNARLAWLTVSGFRQAWGLPTVQPPDLQSAQPANGSGDGVKTAVGS
ncbi:transcriptional regulator [Amycolatopsis sp. NPDC051903]|uniref:transcriptional regulator n=1 Tax=Amycolatopsis sp. NPDC051903 TaxID=3363936 RepID=UPI00378B743B